MRWTDGRRQRGCALNSQLKLAIVSLALGIPITGVAGALGHLGGSLSGLASRSSTSLSRT